MPISLHLHEGPIQAREEAASVEEAIELLGLLWSLGTRNVSMTLPPERFDVRHFTGTIDEAIDMLQHPSVMRERATPVS